MLKKVKQIIVVTSILLSGCTVITPNKSQYLIDPVVKTTKVEKSSCNDKSIKIAQAFSDTSLMSRKMKYTYDEQQEFTYSESAWSRAPSRAITAVLLESVRASGLFKNVNNYKSRSRSNLILETNIEEFVQHYEDNNTKSFVKAIISFSLVDAKTSTTIDNKTIEVQLNTKTLNAQGGAKALNDALAEILQKSNEWLGSLCR
jgi:cholesterol transport system auxiliary component